MHFSMLDAYFHMAAQGNKEAYDKLYQSFKNQALAVIGYTLKQIGNFTGNPSDFSDYVDILFFRAINEYEADRGSFCNYVDYILNIRVSGKVNNTVYEYLANCVAIKEETEDIKRIETIADPNQQTVASEVVINNFKSRISSPKIYGSAKERTREKVLLLQYAGYNNREICRELKISLGELRGHIKKIQEDGEIINFKLELK